MIDAKKELVKANMFSGFNLTQGGELIKSCIGLQRIPTNPDTLNAAMRLSLRLTRHYIEK